jgi:hypothetical protein
MNPIKRFFRRTFESIKQLVFWFPVIWKTRDFDYHYIIEMLTLKLEKMFKFMTSKDCMSEPNEQSLLALKRCIEILHVIDDEIYSDIAFTEHYEKFPIKPFEEMFIDDPKYPKFRVMKGMETDESESFHRANEASEKLHNELMNEFSKLFTTYYRWWWD